MAWGHGRQGCGVVHGGPPRGSGELRPALWTTRRAIARGAPAARS
ncbi:hypothetical protein D187_004534 [Cystobacter fuscus DSM 2262]|uniref:Uncharacterized protein n=1 Tax=Cystobacter fuscus (strain ATCC 25194 / DSM 2262 / NBRC 100088 / M29) TaxID=1242864 RepID=S9P0M3_CYSF2|nr:hypothetical protein D187_004534 [Cystobacter fuscus DSM 2262]